MKMFTESGLLELLRLAHARGFDDAMNAQLGESPSAESTAEYLLSLVHSDAGGYDGKGRKIDG